MVRLFEPVDSILPGDPPLGWVGPKCLETFGMILFGVPNHQVHVQADSESGEATFGVPTSERSERDSL